MLDMTDQPPPPTPDVNVPSPPPQSGRSWVRRFLIGGCLGKEPATLNTGSMTIIDSEGHKCEADPDKFGYVPDDRNIFLENVNPSVTGGLDELAIPLAAPTPLQDSDDLVLLTEETFEPAIEMLIKQ